VNLRLIGMGTATHLGGASQLFTDRGFPGSELPGISYLQAGGYCLNHDFSKIRLTSLVDYWISNAYFIVYFINEGKQK